MPLSLTSTGSSKLQVISQFNVKEIFLFFVYFLVADLYHSAYEFVRFDPYLSLCVFCLMLEFRWEAGVSDHQEEGKRS